jgi:hypothetical protein
MKKFLMCFCASTPPLKGIYTALFILMLTVPVFSQVEQTDKTPVTTPFHKWEVGFDLKPLFRSDEPYNVLIKRYLSKNQALRLGLGAADISSNKGNTNLGGEYYYTKDSIIYFGQNRDENLKEQKFSVFLGYQFQRQLRQLSLYCAADLFYQLTHYQFVVPVQGYFNYSGVDPTPKQIPLSGRTNNVDIFGIKGILGLKYSFNHALSLSTEMALIFQSEHLKFSEGESFFSTTFDLHSALNSSHTTNKLLFKPIMGIYLNYSF